MNILFQQQQKKTIDPNIFFLISINSSKKNNGIGLIFLSFISFCKWQNKFDSNSDLLSSSSLFQLN